MSPVGRPTIFRQMPMRRAVAGLIVAGLCAVLAATTISPVRVDAAAGGRVTLIEPVRLSDTRNAGGPITHIALPTLGHLTVLDAQLDGFGTFHPCDEPPGPTPSFLFEAHEAVYTKVVGSDPPCVTLSTPAHVIIDSFGSVDASPTVGGLQYVPADARPVVFDAEVTGASTQATPLEIGTPPAAAKGAVFLIEARNPTSVGYAAVWRCPSAIRSDVSFINDRAVGLSYVKLTGDPVCLTHYGSTPLRVTLLGWLSSDGPDPTRLPPSLAAPLQPVRLPGLRAIPPQRVLDTRSAVGVATNAKLVAGSTLELAIPQAAASTTAVALNVTVTEPDGAGFLTVFPCDQNRPTASNLNYVRGETVPNLVNVKLSITGTVCIFTQSPTHLIVDVSGTFETDGGAGAMSLSPTRVLDTRIPVGVATAAKIEAGHEVVLQIAGQHGVPSSGVSAVTMNVTVTEPELDGFVTVFPCDVGRPTASNLNYTAGQTVPNLVTVRVSPTGTVCLFTQRTTHLVADVAAWYGLDQPDGYRELVPDRLLDTRMPVGVPSAGPLTGGDTLVLQVAGRGGVPSSGASAVTMNVTAVDPSSDGFVTVYPCDATRPTVSNLNHTAGEIVPNLVTVRLAANGTVCLFAQRTTDLVADVAGYFTSVPEVIFSPSLVDAG